MEGVSTDSLRTLAPKWNLAGDDQLLNLLQSTHQRIVSKCKDVNSRLEEMASALDDASINLQNVNNKFMALSNSQFIESRVYDDDADLTTDTQPVQEIPPTTADELSILKASLAALERAHDTAEIFDESDSDSDAEISVVLKPKDMYSHRPLPYIIGSQPWKNKWHAGLIVEDSDSDSCTSKRDGDIEQYSDSEEEGIRPTLEENTLSESSSSLPGSLGAPPPLADNVPARPADIAAALARRLAADTVQVVQEVEEYIPAAPAQPTKLYKPEQPASSAIFPDEPPPLEEYSGESSNEDIFAEINKHTPYTQKNKIANNLAEDLFSFDKPSVEQGDIFNDFAPTQIEKPSSKQKSSLFEEGSEPELFAEPPRKETQYIEKQEPSTKKPIGGISLFGSNKGAESIGAAILKRNQCKSSSGDESGSNEVKNRNNNTKQQISEKPKVLPRSSEKVEHKTLPSKNEDETDNESTTKKEKDIFNDLFSKSEKVQKKTAQTTKETIKVATVKEKEKPSIKDLFSENLFDDIDDIFTSNVKIPTKQSNQKSIFDDDLFSDVDTSKTTTQSKDNKTNVKESNKNDKSIFESDDELFSDIKTVSYKPVTENVESHKTKSKNNTHENVDNEKFTKIEHNKRQPEITKERKLLLDSPQIVISDPKPHIKSKSIFDSDSDDDIFAKIKTPDSILNDTITNVTHSNKKTIHNINKKTESNDNLNQLSSETLKAKEKVLVQSPALFEEDEIDDQFIAVNIVKSETDQNKDTKVVESKKNHSLEKDPVGEKDSRIVTSNKIYDKEMNDQPKITEHQEPDTKMNPEPNQNVTGKSVTFDGYLPNDGLLSTSKEGSKNTDEKISDVIESSQEVNETEKISAKNTPDEILTEVIESNQKGKETEKISAPKLLGPGVGNMKNNEVETEIDKTHKSEKENVKQPVVDHITRLAKEQDISTTEPKIPVPNADIFDDIFTEPPAFEKPAEPKKSKNVNALFDDDSDDESLFFKKDDVISDEKPEIFAKNANFDIFVDEPPDDIDFTPKLSNKIDTDDDLSNSVLKTTQTIQCIKLVNDEKDICSPMQEKENVSKDTENVKSGNEDDLFISVSNKKAEPNSKEICNNKDLKPVPEKQDVPDIVRVLDENTKEDNIFDETSLPSPGNTPYYKIVNESLSLPKTDNNNVNGNTCVSREYIDSKEELLVGLPSLPKSSQTYQNKDLKPDKNDVQHNVSDSKKSDLDDIFKSDLPKMETDITKIGKINTKNFNINVNALIPGASPKKMPKENKNEERSDFSEPNMFKITPDEIDYDASNKDVSKVTDKLNDNSETGILDNKLSKQRPKIQVKRRPSSRKARHEAVRKSAIDFGDDTDHSSSFDEPKPRDLKGDMKETSDSIKNNISNEEEVKEYASEKDNTNKQHNMIKEDDSIIKYQPTDQDRVDKLKITIEQNITQTKDIINQNSDIFESILSNIPSNSNDITGTNEETQNLVENKQTTTKIVYILNDEDIFNTDSKNIEKSENIFERKISENDISTSTAGIKTLGKTYKENSGKIKYSSKSTKEEISATKDYSKTNKTSLFDDSDDELFSKNKKMIKKTTIFDSDSEEDLFSGKKSTEKKNKEVRNREVKERREVKSSLFGDDDDDDDLFGVKKEKPEQKQKFSLPSTSKETYTSAAIASKSAESVFDDPLSMLGDD